MVGVCLMIEGLQVQASSAALRYVNEQDTLSSV